MLDPLPLSKVCWFPDRSDTIIYAAGDSRLYRYIFSKGETSSGSTLRAEPICCEAAMLDGGQVQFRALCWSSNPALGACLLASLTYLNESSPAGRDLHLWWLQLSPDGDAIIATGSMIAPEEDGAELFWDGFRWPAVGMTRDGLPLLAYLARVRDRSTWDLWVAPIVAGGTTGGPVFQVSAGRKVAELCAPLETVFSAKGRWIHAAICQGTNAEFRVKRFAVPRFEHRKAPGNSTSTGSFDVPACHSRRQEEAREPCSFAPRQLFHEMIL